MRCSFLQSRLLPAEIWVSSTRSIKKGCPATAQESTCFVPASSIVGTFAAAQACDSWELANCSCVSDMSLGKNKNSWESPAFWETRDTVSACQSCDCVSERRYRFTLACCVVVVPACFHGHGKPLLKAEPWCRHPWCVVAVPGLSSAAPVARASAAGLTAKTSNWPQEMDGACSHCEGAWCCLWAEGKGYWMRKFSTHVAADLLERRGREGRLYVLF